MEIKDLDLFDNKVIDTLKQKLKDKEDKNTFFLFSCGFGVFQKNITREQCIKLIRVLEDKYTEDDWRVYTTPTETHFFVYVKKEIVDKVAKLSKIDYDQPTADAVNHPTHYCSDPSGVECIDITQHRDFCIGNAIKYLWRAGLKQDADKTAKEKQIEDLKKAIWYINAEIDLLQNSQE